MSVAIYVVGFQFGLAANADVIAEWRFDGTADDSSTNQHNGVATNVAYTANRFGQTNKAALLSTNSSVTIDSLNSLQYQPISYNLWFRLDNYIPQSVPDSHLNAVMTLLGREGPTVVQQGAIALYSQNNTGIANEFVYYTGDDGFRSTIVPTLGEWNMLTFTYDQSNKASFYLNGKLVRSTTYTAPQNATIPFQIGASLYVDDLDNSSRLSWRGAVDDVVIYAQALSSSDIAQLYAYELRGPDIDNDGLGDYQENQIGTNPNNPDTDGDGLKDGAEYLLADLGFDPLVDNRATIAGLLSDPNKAFLFTQAQYNANRTNGQNDVTTNPSAFSLFTLAQYNNFGSLQFSNGVASVINAMPTIEASAPASTFFRAGFGSNNVTGVTASNLPTGWKFDPSSRQIFGRFTGTNPISAQIIAQRGSNAPIPFVFNLIPQRSQAISPFTLIAARTFGNPAPSFSITAPVSSAGLPVGVTVKSGPATISNNTITLTGAGQVVLAANQDGDKTTAPAAEVTTTFSVARGSQTIAFGPLNSEPFVAGKQIQLSATATSGLPVAFSVAKTNVVILSGSTATIVGRGTATIKASRPSNTNWNAASSVSQTLVVY